MEGINEKLEGAFSDQDRTVINYAGENFYRACGAFVAAHVDGSSSFCVKRVNHPGNVHEDFDGVLRSVEQDSPSDGFSDNVTNVAQYAEADIHFDEMMWDGKDVGAPTKDRIAQVAREAADGNEFAKRYIAWERAKALVDAAVERFGLKEVQTRPSGFTMGYSTTDTPVDQYLVHIQAVADWLLGEND